MIGLSGFAYTASNTVPETKAGNGAGTISGYAVSNVSYTLSTTDPSKIDKVGFVLDAAAGSVQAKVDSTATTYTSCTNPSGNTWDCDFATDVNVADADELRVVAAD